MPWIDACSAKEIDAEDVVRFDHNGRTFAIFRNDKDEYYSPMASAPMKRSIWRMD